VPLWNAPSDTIAAIATPRGEGGVAVLRVSGPRAEEILRALCPKIPATITPNLMYPRGLSWRGEAGDFVLVVLFRAPRSFTGEDVVEFHAHGGALNAEKILSWTLQAGAVLAAPGEFTRRAFENGKLDLSQAQAIADLIAARSEGAHRLALRAAGGSLRRILEQLQTRLIEVMAEVEAAIDFPEEDLQFLEGPAISGALSSLEGDCRALAATYTAGRLLREGAEVALIGRPNVGKSSLLNALLGEERAIVTAKAGTTRDPIRGELDLDGVRVVLVDTAGLREVDDEAEQLGVARARSYLAEAAVRLVLLDGTVPLGDEDRAILRQAEGLPHLVVRTKGDLPQAWSMEGDLCLSSRSGEGIAALRRALSARVTQGVDLSAEVAVSHAHQRDALARVAESLRGAQECIARQLPPEVAAEELHGARAALEEVTGRGARDEILGEIFRRFCIGK
jgi:tRNA modification GTPase